MIELQSLDGTTVADAYERFTSRTLTRGDRLEHDGVMWLMRDREDRAGVTVYLFTPATGEPAQARVPVRPRRRSL